MFRFENLPIAALTRFRPIARNASIDADVAHLVASGLQAELQGTDSDESNCMPATRGRAARARKTVHPNSLRQ